ncbi:MAG: hypothetical protein K6E33_01255 [Lachnospiraceae bacterium]|nr:hypothetical protein [Lachnospiraceae bacterium]
MKKILTVIIAMSLFMSFSLTAFAAPVTMPGGGKFDPEYYAASNPDVVASVGTSTPWLYYHYLTYGAAEGRLPYSPTATTTTNPGDAYKNVQWCCRGDGKVAYKEFKGELLCYDHYMYKVYPDWNGQTYNGGKEIHGWTMCFWPGCHEIARDFVDGTWFCHEHSLMYSQSKTKLEGTGNAIYDKQAEIDEEEKNKDS